MGVPRECLEFARLQSEATLLVDGHGRILFANAAAATLLERTPTELHGRLLGAMVEGGDEEVARVLCSCARSDEPALGKLTLSGPGGAPIHFPYRGQQLRRARDGVRGLVVLQREVGARFRTLPGEPEPSRREIRSCREHERAVRDSEAELQAIWSSVGEAAIVTERQGRVVRMNTVAEDLLGCRLGEARGRPLSEIFGILDGETGEVIPDPVATVVSEGRRVDLAGKATVITRGGKEHAIAGSAAPILDESGDITGVLLLFRDVTEELHRRSQLEHERAFAEGVLDGVGTLVAVTEPSGKIVRCNRTFERVSGYSPDELRGRSIWELFSNREEALELRQRCFDVCCPIRPYTLESTLRTRAGETRRISWSCTCIGCEDGGVGFIIMAGLDLTERLEAERERTAVSQQLAVFAERSPVGLFRMDRKTGLTWGNPRAVQIAGLTKQEELSERWVQRLHPDDRARVRAEWEAAAESEQSFKSEFRFQYPDGRVVWVLGQALAEPGHDGEGASLLGTLTDVTERAEAEAALRQSEERFRIYIDSAPDAVFVADARGRYLEVNAAAGVMTGYATECLLELGIEDIIHPDSLDQALRDFAKLAKGERVQAEYLALRADGSQYWMAVDAVRLSDDRFMAFASDVTERRERVDRLRQLTTAIEQAADTVVVTDVDGMIEYVNPAFEQTTGYSRAEALGNKPKILRSGVHDHAFYEELWSTIASGRVWTGRFQNRRKDGTIYPEDATISPIASATGEIVGYVAVKRDVTERLRLEEGLREAQRMESVGRLAGGVAHDFNNLLMVIGTCCELAGELLRRTDPIRALIDEIASAVERAEGLTRQLLAFSRQQVLQPRVLDLNRVVRELSKMLGRLIGEDIELRNELDGNLASIEVDPGQVEQVILNLAVNARDAMPDGGTLTIATSNVDLAPGDLGRGSYVRLSVRDDGSGLSPELTSKIFEPFFTTKKPGKGTGLGLSTVHGIIKQSGGHILVESELGVGTTFHIYFPASTSEPEELGGGANVVAEGGNETILVVEDDGAVRRLLVRTLENQCYRVLQARSGSEALSMTSVAPELDLMLCDVVMPGASGPQVAAAFVECNPKLEVLFMSGYASDQFDYGALEDGRLLAKPFSARVLRRRVREILDAT